MIPNHTERTCGPRPRGTPMLRYAGYRGELAVADKGRAGGTPAAKSGRGRAMLEWRAPAGLGRPQKLRCRPAGAVAARTWRQGPGHLEPASPLLLISPGIASESCGLGCQPEGHSRAHRTGHLRPLMHRTFTSVTDTTRTPVC